MKQLCFIALILALCFKTFAQHQVQIKQQAQICANAFVSGDYNKFADFLYPKMIAMSGGKPAIIAAVKNQISQMGSQGYAIKKAAIGQPGKEYTAGTELHCLVPEILTIKLKDGHLIATSYLLAISSNQGKSWYFMDINKATSGKLKQMFPNFNSALVVPQPTAPVFYKDTI